MTVSDLSPRLQAMIDALPLKPGGRLLVDGGNPLREIALQR